MKKARERNHKPARYSSGHIPMWFLFRFQHSLPLWQPTGRELPFFLVPVRRDRKTMAVPQLGVGIIEEMKLYPRQAIGEVSDNCAFDSAFAPIWGTDIMIPGELVDPLLLDFVAINAVRVRGPGTPGWDENR